MSYEEELKGLRKHIDLIDESIYQDIVVRLLYTSQIGLLKKEFGVNEMSQTRRDEILEKIKGWAINDGVPVYMVSNIFNELINASTLEQTLIINEVKKLG